MDEGGAVLKATETEAVGLMMIVELKGVAVPVPEYVVVTVTVRPPAGTLAGAV
jgi:hypothetical protein